MDFFSVVLVLLIYYIRPQDWVPGLLGMGIVTPVMLLAIATMFLRARQTGRQLKFFQTPHDWGMLAYYVFIVYSSPDPSGALKGAFPLFAFYFVTVQALDSSARLYKYLKFWMLALVVIASFGVGSLFGWDPTGAAGMTEANKGRLAIGTWMHNNPNSLGHTVILVIPLAYFLYFWRKPMWMKVVAVAVSWLAFQCVLATQSKGAFLAGFMVLVLSYAFGRSKIFQIMLVSAALAGGGALLSFLPRMSEMGDLRSDEGVQGRLLAWEIARSASRQHLVTGQGWKTFKATIRWQKFTLTKATHSSYVQIGAELGKGGMFIYVGLFWLGLRSLIRFKAKDEEAERCRKGLFALLAAYAISNWMIDRAYHAEFFLVMAATGAFHRLFLLKAPVSTDEPEEEPQPDRAMRPVQFLPECMPVPAPIAGPYFARSITTGWASGQGPSAPADSDATPKRSLAGSLLRPSGLDYVVAAAAAWAIFAVWDYILKSMLY